MVNAVLIFLIIAVFLTAVFNIETNFDIFNALTYGFGLLISLLVFLFGFALTGYFNGSIIGVVGRRSKNRNVKISMFFSLFASIITICGLYVYPFHFFIEALFEYFWGANFSVILFFIIGSIISTIFGLSIAKSAVEENKFCEKCEKNMEEIETQKLDINNALNIREYILNKNFTDLKSKILSDEDPDIFYYLKMFICPKCTEAYLEVWVKAKLHWVEKSENKKEGTIKDKWLYISQYLKPNEVIQIKQKIQKILKNQPKI